MARPRGGWASAGVPPGERPRRLGPARDCRQAARPGAAPAGAARPRPPAARQFKAARQPADAMDVSLFGSRSFRFASTGRPGSSPWPPTRRGVAAAVGLSLLFAGILITRGAGGPPAGLPPVGWSKGGALPGSFVIRWDAAYGYLPTPDKVVLFGGSPKAQTETWRNDTWIYANDVWSLGPSAPAGLTPRGGSAMGYDPDIGKLVLFGGADGAWPPT